MTLLLHLCDSIVITCYIQTVHRLALLAVKCITQRGDSAVTLLVTGGLILYFPLVTQMSSRSTATPVL